MEYSLTRIEIYPEELYRNVLGYFNTKEQATNFMENEIEEMRKRNLDISSVEHILGRVVVEFKDSTIFEYSIC